VESLWLVHVGARPGCAIGSAICGFRTRSIRADRVLVASTNDDVFAD
jgi:hypothetical protein